MFQISKPGFNIRFNDAEENKFKIKFNNQFITRTTLSMYEGEYSVTPSVDTQILETMNKVMQSDMVIEKIPYYMVSNDKGDTFIIGGDLQTYGN